ncbi:hypothetical protein GA0116948_11142 [Chitinophaga costaii]|uniref:Uncharacterized protein n=1 Tax=Chitinophaga costaii TaxID=1335309 RepID=A0A1C4F2C1_9BACT|nr:hypothetical protein DCM91_15565 [Chitinophaga costaii]SCC49875.1 hypothetical protein GA0116948_11142 [Chitinophaga costaii]
MPPVFILHVKTVLKKILFQSDPVNCNALYGLFLKDYSSHYLILVARLDGLLCTLPAGTVLHGF